MDYGIEQMPVEEFLDQFGIPIEVIIENLDYLKGLREKVHVSWPGESIPIGKAIRNYLNDISKDKSSTRKGMSKTTVDTKKTELYGLLKTFCKRCIREKIKPTLANILEDDIHEYLDKKNAHDQTSEIENTTYNKKLAIIKVFFKVMVKKGFIEDSPASDIDRKQESDLPIQFLTREEQSQIFKIALEKREAAQRDFMIVFTALNGGLRLNDIVKLDVTDFNYMEGTLHVRHSKNDKSRIIPLTKETKEELKNYIEKKRGINLNGIIEPNQPLFLESKGTNKSERLSREACRKAIKRIFIKAGIVEGASHRMRHTYAVNALQSGLNIVEIASVLGHAHVSTTYTYLRLSNEDIRKKMEKQFPLAFLSIGNIEEYIKTEEQSKKARYALRKLGELS